MSATPRLRAYPRDVTLRDGGSITIRPLERRDESALLEFFVQVPEDDLFFLKDDVTSTDIIRDWTQNLDHNRAVSLVAIDDGRILGEGVVVKRRGGARGHVGEIRLTVGPSWRNRGVGTAMIRALCEVASDADLDAVLFEIVEDGEGAARLSTKHTLALTNRGGATTAELLALAREIRDGVEARFGIRLVNEPVLVGCAL